MIYKKTAVRYKTEIHCDNCEAEIESPKDIHKIDYFGTRKGSTAIVRSMVCPWCAEDFQARYTALFIKD